MIKAQCSLVASGIATNVSRLGEGFFTDLLMENMITQNNNLIEPNGWVYM